MMRPSSCVLNSVPNVSRFSGGDTRPLLAAALDVDELPQAVLDWRPGEPSFLFTAASFEQLLPKQFANDNSSALSIVLSRMSLPRRLCPLTELAALGKLKQFESVTSRCDVEDQCGKQSLLAFTGSYSKLLLKPNECGGGGALDGSSSALSFENDELFELALKLVFEFSFVLAVLEFSDRLLLLYRHAWPFFQLYTDDLLVGDVSRNFRGSTVSLLCGLRLVLPPLTATCLMVA